jgi:cellulose synthase/poly-beta-1,6-N-acetylglucosamine synthase-like glycosyltransferase
MISIIITAYKEARTIGKAIEQVLKNNLKKYEIIITAPDEETLEAAKKYSKKFRFIKLLKDKGEGKPAALTLAFKKSKGDVLILTDGDVYINENSLGPLVKKFLEEGVGAVSGHPISLNSKESMLGYWSHLLLDVADKLRRERVKKNKFILCSGYLFALKKGIVDKIPSSVLDDAYISKEVWNKNYKILYEENSKVYVQNPQNFKDWVKQKKRNVFGEFQLDTKKDNSMRSFKEESKEGWKYVLSYPKNLREYFWMFLLIFARIYVWVLATIEKKIKKKSMRKIWKRVESTK